MQCRDVQTCLHAFLDDELDCSSSAEIQRHLDQCCHCAREAEIERAIGRSLRRGGEEPAPPIERFMPPEQGAAGFARSVTPSRRRRARFASTALAALLVAACILWIPTSRAPTFTDSLVSRTWEVWSGHTPFDVESTDPSRINRWARRTLGWDVKLAALSTERRRQLGAASGRVNGIPALFVLYDVAGQPASVVIMPTAKVNLSPMRPPDDENGCYRDRCRGHAVMAARRGVLTYFAVGQLPEHDLAELVASRVASR